MKDNRISQLFKTRRKVLNIFVTAGFPTLEATIDICTALAASGADMIELGLPFSDPIADGPVIQQANQIALANGVTTRWTLATLAAIRARGVEIPILLMGHLNPLLQYGLAEFCRDAADAGADGVILPDLPHEFYLAHYRDLFERHNLSVVFLATSATPEARVRELDAASLGFIYAVALTGVTGSHNADAQAREAYLQRLAGMNLRNPVLAGFGVATRQDFEAITKTAAGAIVGTAFIKALAAAPDVTAATRAFVRALKGTEQP